MTLDEATELASSARGIRLLIKKVKSNILEMEHLLASARRAGAPDDYLREFEILIKEMRAFAKGIL